MDLMLLGEGEEMVPELCDLVIKAREEGWSRSRLIEEAVNIPGVYAPSLYTHDANGVLTPLKPDLPTPGRRIVADFDRAAYPEKQVVPFGAVHNRLSLEIARGCTGVAVSVRRASCTAPHANAACRIWKKSSKTA